jgi:methyltransferase (TIGR00027 family)
MQPHQASRTAAIMAAFRASETAKPRDRRLFSDPYAKAFSPPALRVAASASRLPVAGGLLTRFIDWRWPGARSSAVARTRLIDDWIGAAISGDVEQCVILGAGFDSRAWRLPALAQVRTFEVDHPATSAAKEDRLSRLGVARQRVDFVRVDFEREDFAPSLEAAGFDAGRRSLVLWEGVSQYLDAQSVARVFAWAGRLAPGSRMIFTYVDAGVLDKATDFFGAQAILRAVQKSHEAWTWGSRPDELRETLAAVNLEIMADLGAAEYRPLVMGEEARGQRGYEFYRVACAKVRGAEAHA